LFSEFGEEAGDVTVILEDLQEGVMQTPCSVTSASDSEVVCSINGRYPVGSKDVRLLVDGKGKRLLISTHIQWRS